MARWWLWWHSRHGQIVVRYTNPKPIHVQALTAGTVVSIRLGGIPGRLSADGVMDLGHVDLRPMYACPCGAERPK